MATVNSAAGSYTLVPSGASSSDYTITYANGTLVIDPAANNFMVSSGGVSCKNAGDGTISVTADQMASYSAKLTGGGTTKTLTFSKTLSVGNLQPGSYNLCISNTAVPDYQACFDLVITQPQDLSVFSVVDKGAGNVTLSLAGGDNYNIVLNGQPYSTSASSITLPLIKGSNRL